MRSVPYGLAALADQDRARGNPLYKLLCLRKTRPVTGADEKQALHRYLRNARGVLLWKLEGLSGYDIRRPVTPTGTNLLGLVKHCAGVECGYFGAVMSRPFPGEDDLPWWPEERRHPTLHTLLVHTIQETARHAGHADIIRESIDGAAGLREGVSNMPAEAGAAAWKQHYDKVDQIARSAR